MKGGPAGLAAWEYRVRPDRSFTCLGVDRPGRALVSGEVRIDFIAGGICGSDVGALSDLDARVGDESQERNGPIVPLHEVAGLVVESRSSRLTVGQHVVGTGASGLVSSLIEKGDNLIPIPAVLSPVEAIAVQPLSTVIRSVKTLPDIAGQDVVVFGAGPIGLAFVHVLHQSGARRVTSIDPVASRRRLAEHYGADEFLGCTGEDWGRELATSKARPLVIIDAVGRRPELLSTALQAVADEGFVLAFGAAGPRDYLLPFSEMYHRRLTLASGRTRSGWHPVLEAGAEYLLRHREAFADYVNVRFDVEQAEDAYRLCEGPDGDRVKVAIVAGE